MMRHWLPLAALFICTLQPFHSHGKTFNDQDSLVVFLNQGWNIFSSPLVPDSADLKIVFRPLIENGNLIKIQNETGYALENFGVLGGWKNFIGNLLPSEGYKIKVTVSCKVTFRGTPVVLPYEIPLKAGWNIIGFPVRSERNGREVIQSLIDRKTLIKVQDEKGNAIENMGVFGGWTNNIGNFKPGEGYKIKVTADEILVIPSGLPDVTTSNITIISQTTATGGGNVTGGGSDPVTLRGVCWNTTGSPTITDSKTSDGGGTGTFISTLTALTSGTTYYVRAYATNSQGTAYGNQLTFTTPSPVVDADGNVYKSVIIGDQEWMAENLRTTRYSDGTPITNITDNAAWIGLTAGAYCWYGNDGNNRESWGGLYNWYAATDSHKLCPAGWHMPDDSEWTKLILFLGGELVAGGKLKEAGTTRWASPNTEATNESGFTALPSGIRGGYGAFYNAGNLCYFWSSTSMAAATAWCKALYYDAGDVGNAPFTKFFGFSIRCLKDN